MTRRFVVGIDLGTTNSAVAYVDLEDAGAPRLRLFEVPQAVAPGEVAARDTLPSFVYFENGRPTSPQGGLIESGERRPVEGDKDEPAYVVGVYARDQGALQPSRQISSAKSWLSHPAIDRTARILPWAADEPLMSPVDASAAILRHIKEAWNAAGARQRYPLEHQDIVLTVPASFDPEARELTLQAARDAGLASVTLLEEPLAAFYAWIASHPEALRRRRGARPTFHDGELVLVCDVGGGTSDFTLIRVHVHDAEVSFERTAVGEHVLLGGDNLDLALARQLERKLGDRGLSLVQRLALRRSASTAKERLLTEHDRTADAARDRRTIAILGSGRSLVGGSLTTELTRDEVIDALITGFLPIVDAGARPARDRRTGLRELGLPYAEDAAITRHLAAFLHDAAAAAGPAGAGGAAATGAEAGAGGAAPRGAEAETRAEAGAGMARPDAVLFNGGFFTPPIARERVIENLRHWFSAGPAEWQPTILENEAPAAAVALGAAYYALARRRGGLRVRAGSSRAYYIGVQSGDEGAVCILPRGTEEGTRFDLGEREFAVMTNKPVVFPLFSSAVRHDALGALVSAGRGELHAHAPLATVLRYGKKSRQVELAIHLSTTFTETGTLEVSCASRTSEHRWRLHFQLRGERDALRQEGIRGTSPEPEGIEGEREAESMVAPERLAAAQAAIAEVFGSPQPAGAEVDSPSRDAAGTAGTESRATAEREASATGSDSGTGVPARLSAGAEARATVGGEAHATGPESLPAFLEATLGFGRQAWPLPIIRTLADALLGVSAGRKKGPRFEARWLNLLGFCLRPGFGAPLDDWRVGQARGIYQEGLAFPKDLQCQAEWIVLWQRVAGGLKAGQQRELYQRYATVLDIKAGRRTPRLNPQIQREAWRLLASLEQLSAAERGKLGEVLLERLDKDPDNASYLWAIGRFGARTPAHGPVTSVIPSDRAERWIDRLLALKTFTPDTATAVAQIGARSEDPLRDIGEDARARAVARLEAAGFAREVEMLREFQPPAARDALQLFGEALPVGLRIRGE